MNHDSLVMTLLMLQFDLQDFDKWLDTLGDCPARQELQRRRDKLVARVSAGKVIRYNATDDDSEPAIKRELEFLMGRRREIQREDVLLPGARRDQKLQGDRRKPRRGRWPELDDFIREILTADPKATAKEIFDALPDSFSGDTFYRDGQEIVSATGKALQFGGFEKRVSSIRQEIRNSR